MTFVTKTCGSHFRNLFRGLFRTPAQILQVTGAKIIFAITLHKIYYSESSCERFTVTNIYWYGKRLANAKERTRRLQKSLHGTCLSPAFLCHRKLGQTRTTQTIPALFAAFVFRLSCGRRGVGANYYYNCASFIREICLGKETGERIFSPLSVA